MTTAVSKVIEQVRTLSPEELCELRDWMNTSIQAAATDSFGQKLIELGIGRPRGSSPFSVNPHPLEAKGRPLSEELIEERR